MLKQSTGQMSRHASHSMHSESVKWVWMSQFRQRCTSAAVCSAVNPISTSVLRLLKRATRSTCTIFWRLLPS